jgi:alpha-D-ribose 1-methylphosphonate 5-triphosphate diphosphatase
LAEVLCLAGGTAILPDRLLDGARIVIEDGTIVDVSSQPGHGRSLDTTGLLMTAGLIDVHSDGLEREIQPRAGVELSADLALAGFEGRLRAAGITTVFHGVAFEENRTWSRSLALAHRSYDAIEARRAEGSNAVDHQILHRLDARDGPALAALEKRLVGWRPLVSFEDHTPGQGQFRDLSILERMMIETGATPNEAHAKLRIQLEEREALRSQYEVSLERLSSFARQGKIRLLVHDPTDPEQIDRFVELGAEVAEFPCTYEAAERAKHHDLPIVLGAPNVVLGGSHSGNVAAVGLIAAGWGDALASDYAPQVLLASAFELARSGTLTLPAALRLVTAGPARVAALDDRGALEVGMRGDVLVVDDRGRWPRIVTSFRAGERTLVPGLVSA